MKRLWNWCFEFDQPFWHIISGVIVLGSIFLVCFAVFIGLLIAWFGSTACADMQHQYGRPTNYSYLSGVCYLTLPDGHKINADNYIAYLEAK